MKHLALAAAFAVFALPAFAQTAPNNATQQFVNKAAVSDMFEVQSSKLALEKSNNNQIKQFAQEMVDDHSKTTEELKSMVQKVQGMQMPNAMDSEHQQKLEQLRSASAAQFDQRYRTQQIEGHQAAVKLFQNYSNTGENAELKSWAQKTLPHLQQHLQKAQALPQTQAPAVGAAPAQPGQQGAQTGQAQRNQQSMARLASPGPNQLLASDLRGTRVHGANNENIGDINDILMEKDGRVVAVIVGVGGFLGIGEKNVAVPFQALEFASEQRGGTAGTADRTTGTADRTTQQGQQTMKPDRIVLRGMTKADLEAAPNFKNDGSAERGQSPGTGTRPGNTPRQ